MRAFAVRPKRDLGQNFLIDSNILGVIAREAQLDADDVVLEIGGGLGVLSEYLAPRVAHLHVVELDRGLEPALRDAIDVFDNVTLHIADAMKLDLRALDPAPTKVAANLPYGIAAGAILRTLEELDGARRWVGMVQRRLASASPPSRARAPTGCRRCSRSCAAMCRCCARSPARSSRRCRTSTPSSSGCSAPARAEPALRDLVAAAFAHRREALAGCAGAGPGGSAGDPAARRAALAGARPPTRRARGAPVTAGLSRPARKLARMAVLTTQAYAKINLRLFVGPLRGDDQHEVVTLMDSLTLADDVRMDTAAPGLEADEVLCPAISGPNLAAEALRAFRERRAGTPRRSPGDRQAHTDRRRHGRRIGGRRGRAAPRRRASARPRRRQPPPARGDRGDPRRRRRKPDPRRARARDRHRRRLRPLNASLAYSVVVGPVDAQLSSGAVYAEADRLGLPRDALELAAAR